MPKRFLGNIMTDAPTAPDGNFQHLSTSGVWSLNEAFGYRKADVWPTAGNVLQRAIFAGGATASSAVNVIEFFNFTSAGNAADFGDLTKNRDGGVAGIGSSTRGIIAGGQASNPDMDYISILSQGNAVDFGDLQTFQSITNSTQRKELGGGGNETRGIIVGTAALSGANKIEYITIASLGNSVDFGDTSDNTSDNQARAAGSTTRLIFGGFQQNKDHSEYITIGSTGNSQEFGDLGGDTFSNSAVVSSSTRCVWMGGSNTDNMVYVTIASTGAGSAFGNLTASRRMGAGASNKTLGTIMGGDPVASPYRTNIIEQITIATAANSTDWGDLTAAKRQAAGLSNAHGGLS